MGGPSNMPHYYGKIIGITPLVTPETLAHDYPNHPLLGKAILYFSKTEENRVLHRIIARAQTYAEFDMMSAIADLMMIGIEHPHLKDTVRDAVVHIFFVQPTLIDLWIGQCNRQMNKYISRFDIKNKNGQLMMAIADHDESTVAAWRIAEQNINALHSISDFFLRLNLRSISLLTQNEHGVIARGLASHQQLFKQALAAHTPRIETACVTIARGLECNMA